MSNKVVVKFSIYYARDLSTLNIGWMLKDLFPGVALADYDDSGGLCQFNLFEAMKEVLTSSQASGEFFYRAGMDGPVFRWDPISKNVVPISEREMKEAEVFARKTWVKGMLSESTEEARQQAVAEGWKVESENEERIVFARKIVT
jgi:hypothetical protein